MDISLLFRGPAVICGILLIALHGGKIVILSRLAKAIRTQSWFTVVMEVLIVVVGIFLGLQVDAWNQARIDRVDEKTFLLSLHDDVLRTDLLSRRLRQRRIDNRELMLSASDVLFGRIERNTLNVDECYSIVWSTAYNITATGLPSVDELVGTGRMRIIRDTELLTALIALRQTRAALDTTISEKTASSNFISLPRAFPDLFQLTVSFDDTLNEVQAQGSCDVTAMRANQLFLNQFSTNVDGYDAYIRDGLHPWSVQFDQVHELVDKAVAIEH